MMDNISAPIVRMHQSIPTALNVAKIAHVAQKKKVDILLLDMINDAVIGLSSN